MSESIVYCPVSIEVSDQRLLIAMQDRTGYGHENPEPVTCELPISQIDTLPSIVEGLDIPMRIGAFHRVVTCAGFPWLVFLLECFDEGLYHGLEITVHGPYRTDGVIVAVPVNHE